MDESDSRYEAWRLALNRAIAVAGITATVLFPLGFYARSASPAQSSVPILSADGRGYYLVGLIVVLAIAAIVQALETDDPARIENRYGERVYQFRRPAPRTAWILPTITLLTVLAYLGQHHRLAVVLLAPFAVGALILVARLVRFHILQNVHGYTSIAVAGLHTVTYAVAFLALSAIFALRARALVTAPMVFLVAFLLIVQLLDGLSTSTARRMLYAAVGGVALAELAWVLGYWNVTTWIGGAILGSLFFLYASISRARNAGEVTQREIVERAGLAVPALIILAYLAE